MCTVHSTNYVPKPILTLRPNWRNKRSWMRPKLGDWWRRKGHTFQWICSIANRPPDLTKPHCDPANQRRPVRGTQPSSRTLDNPHLGLSGQTILVQHLTNYRLTGQSILYQLQTGWLVSIMILIVPIANWVASGYCNHCRPGGWNVLS